MSDYVRGQETFVNKLVITVLNLLRLGCFCTVLGFLSFLVRCYYAIPRIAWSHLAIIHSDFVFSFSKRLEFKASWSTYLQRVEAFYGSHAGAFADASYFGLGAAILAALTLFVYFRFRGEKLASERYLRGARLISSKEFKRLCLEFFSRERREIVKDAPFIKKASVWRSLEPKHFMGTPFWVNKNLVLYEYLQFRNIGISGGSGTGKTTLISKYLKFCRATSQKAMILDVNGEYADRFREAGDIVLSISDPLACYWSLKNEPEVSADELASYLVSEGGESNSFFWKGARKVLADLLEEERDEGALWKLVNNPNTSELISGLSGLSQNIAGQGKGGQGAGIVGTTVLDLRFLAEVNRSVRRTPDNIEADKSFSLYDWARGDDKRWVFVTFKDGEQETMRPLMKLWFNIALTGLLSRPVKGAKKLTKLNIIVDELSTVGRLQKLPVALDRVRKYGGKIVLGFQSLHQLTNLYGPEGGQAIKAAMWTRFIFRTSERSETKELSDYLGQQESTRKSGSQSYGTKTYSDRENLSEQTSTRPIVLESEIAALPDGYFYLKSLHFDPLKSRVEKRQ